MAAGTLVAALALGARSASAADEGGGAPAGCDDSNTQLFVVGALPGIGAVAANGYYLARGNRPPSGIINMAYFAAVLNLAVAASPLTTMTVCPKAPRATTFVLSHGAIIISDLVLALWSSQLPRGVVETGLYPLTSVNSDGGIAVGIGSRARF